MESVTDELLAMRERKRRTEIADTTLDNLVILDARPNVGPASTFIASPVDPAGSSCTSCAMNAPANADEC